MKVWTAQKRCRRPFFITTGGDQMKTLYLDCGMGAAGDMLTAALLELMDDPEAVIAELNSIGIPDVQFVAEKTEKCGITGTHMHVVINGEEEDEHMHDHHHDHADMDVHEEHNHEHHHDHDHEHHHDHDHEHGHGHSHSHASMHGIEHIVKDHMHLPQEVQDSVLAVYKRIAEAESEVHGVPVDNIHFHEVGTMDAVADITAVCYLMHKLHPDQVLASPVHVGKGTVRCAHGILPVPAPATALILKGVPIYSRDEINGELCTPTGAALLKTFVSEFRTMPIMSVDRIGYGMGKKDFPIANCVRAMLGETEDHQEPVYELNCNVDDMTAEEIAYATNALLAGGAREVFTTSVHMKKNRPGTLITVICTADTRAEIVKLIFKYTTTLGIRETADNRYTLERKIVKVNTEFGEIRRKDSFGYGTSKSKYEYEDLAAAAEQNNCSVAEVRSKILKGE